MRSRLASSLLARNAAWMILAHGARIVAQAGYFILAARALGVHGLGQLAAGLAVVFLLVPFAGLGTGTLLVRQAARAPSSLRSYWRFALLTTAALALALAALAVGVGHVVVGLPLELLLLLAAAELLFGKTCALAGQAFQAVERLRVTAAVTSLLPVARLAAAAAFLALADDRSPTAWAAWYLVAAAAAAGGSVAIVALLLRPEGERRPVPLRELRRALGFAVSHSASLAHADADKVLLARLATFDAAGVYAAAYRAASVALVPVLALLAAAYARFFRSGTAGLSGSSALARRLLPASVAYGLAAGVVLVAVAPLAPVVLGSDFAASVEALRWLAPLPALTALAYLPGDALTGADRQRVRTVLQLAAVAVNVGLNLWLIPAHSWRGAAWATLVSLAFLATALWVAVRVLSRAERIRTVPLPAPGAP